MKYIVFACLAWNAASALGCDCAPSSLKAARAEAEVVFRGKIMAIHDGTVSFRVDRVWKGSVRSTFDMPDFPETSACLGFLPKLLEVGNELLVFAWRLHRYPTDNDYFTSICTRTGLASEVGATIRKLGKGRLPINSPAADGR